MATDNATKQALSRLLRKILSGLSTEWLALLPELFQLVRRWWGLRHPQGMYEILEYDSTLELLDPRGTAAVSKKRQRVKFLQDYVIAFQDYAWGDGQNLAEYRCSPGRVADLYQEGDRWNILISLRETKNRGNVEEFYMERWVKNSFTRANEWRQVEIRHRTRHLKLIIIFPSSRRCQRAVVLARSKHRATPLGEEHFTDLPDGRQQLTWETTKIRHFEIYTLRWWW